MSLEDVTKCDRILISHMILLIGGSCPGVEEMVEELKDKKILLEEIIEILDKTVSDHKALRNR